MTASTTSSRDPLPRTRRQPAPRVSRKTRSERDLSLFGQVTTAGPFLSHAAWPHALSFHRPDVWFHGTPWTYDGLPVAPGPGESGSNDWNAMIGPHFANGPVIAESFTDPEDHEDEEERFAPRIFPVRLRGTRNLHFHSEDHMSALAVSLMLETDLMCTRSYGLPDGPLSAETLLRHHENINELCLDSHTEQLHADTLRTYLITLGYDTITYPNDKEGGTGAVPLLASNILPVYCASPLDTRSTP